LIFIYDQKEHTKAYRKKSRIARQLDEIEIDGDNADKLIPHLAKQLSGTNYDSALGTKFALALQLSNDKKIFEQYELADISELFASLITISDTNLGLYVESAHFDWAVLDNGDKAKDTISKGLEKAHIYVDELKKLLREIDGI
jgi:hypothetical protein